MGSSVTPNSEKMWPEGSMKTDIACSVGLFLYCQITWNGRNNKLCGRMGEV